MKPQPTYTALSLAALVLTGFAERRLLADHLISNTDQPVFGALPIVYSSQWIAAPFRTGANPSLLESISLYEATFGSPSGSFGVAIYGDNHGLPGSSLFNGHLTGPSRPQQMGNQTYTAIHPLTLAPNTLYWVVAASDNGSTVDSYNWGAAANSSYFSPEGWNYPGNYYAQTTDQGATWSLQHWFEDQGGPQLLAIDGRVVPEPSTLALLASMVGGTLASCRKRKN
jgi:hypothetical protein